MNTQTKDINLRIIRIHNRAKAPFEILNLSEETTNAITRLVYLELKTENQKKEIKGIHYKAGQTDAIAKDQYEKGFKDGIDEGKRIHSEQDRAVNIAVSVAYQEGFKDGRKINEMRQVDEKK